MLKKILILIMRLTASMWLAVTYVTIIAIVAIPIAPPIAPAWAVAIVEADCLFIASLAIIRFGGNGSSGTYICNLARYDTTIILLADKNSTSYCIDGGGFAYF